MTPFAAWWRLAALAAAWALCVPASMPQTAVGEAQVKAAFLYRFAAFVEWPATTFETASAPLSLCVVGATAVAAEAERAVVGQRVVSRPIVVRRLPAIAAGSGCHIAYLANPATQTPSEALGLIALESVLTVTDAASSHDARGIVHFQVVDNRVRFHIDDAAAARQGLAISSRLLNIALSVRQRG